MKRYFKGKIKKGIFSSDKQKFKDGCSTLPDGDYLYLLIKTTERNTRECQNHYFAILGERSLDTGYTKAELHDLVKAELFVELFDEPRSTTDLSVDEWNILFWNLENWLILKFENS